MEYLMINESKLKVLLDGSELQNRNLDAHELDYADPYAKKLFGDILCYAKDNLGFDTSGHRVLLQLFPSKDGSCELFITKLGKLEKDAEQPCIRERKKEQAPTKKRKNQKAFRFECLRDLLSVCKRLYQSEVDCSGSAYVDIDGVWYLILSLDDPLYDDVYDVLPINDLSFIFEYGDPENPQTLGMYLCEYARQINAENAIEALGSM
jgi:negative regulator of genetic competence, sporulation and motility